MSPQPARPPQVDRHTLALDELMERCLGNLNFAQRVVSVFEEHFGRDLAALEAGLASDDMDEVARIAHRMKGSSANAAAPQLCRDMASIEELAQHHRSAEMARCILKLREDWSQFRETAQHIRPTGATSGN